MSHAANMTLFATPRCREPEKSNYHIPLKKSLSSNQLIAESCSHPCPRDWELFLEVTSQISVSQWDISIFRTLKPTLQQAREETRTLSKSPANGTCCSQLLSICKCKCFSFSFSKNRNKRKGTEYFSSWEGRRWYGEMWIRHVPNINWACHGSRRSKN